MFFLTVCNSFIHCHPATSLLFSYQFLFYTFSSYGFTIHTCTTHIHTDFPEIYQKKSFAHFANSICMGKFYTDVHLV